MIERAREEAILPEVAAAAMEPIDRPRVAPMRAAQRQRERGRRCGNGHHMHVIGHQAIRENFQVMAMRFLFEQLQVQPVVIVGEEHRLAIVAALGHMMGHAWNDDTGNAGHAGDDSRNREIGGCPEL